MDHNDELDRLKDKLAKLSKGLADLTKQLQDDLGLARKLQSQLHPERLQIRGLECFARYLPAFDLSSESFDLFSDASGKQAWFVYFWTENFGLASILTQVALRFRSRDLVRDLALEKTMSPVNLVREMTEFLKESKRTGRVRLFAACLDLHRLEYVCAGAGTWGPFMREAPMGKGKGSYRRMGDPKAPTTPVPLDQLAAATWEHRERVSPGNRVLFISPGWAEVDPEQDQDMIAEAFTGGSSCLEDLNAALLYARERVADTPMPDISAFVFDVDSKKLHLA